jgi:uncharacterized protein (DUF2141 family)
MNKIEDTPIASLLEKWSFRAFLFVTLCIASVFLSSFITSEQEKSKLTIAIEGINKGNGKVIVAIYNNEADWLEKPFKEITFETSENSKVVSFDVPYGTYAVSVYQDTKPNGETDMNFLGIPKEPVAFGNNYKPFGEPDFEKASVQFNSNYTAQTLKLYTVF